jgi:hypothetical protein
MVYPQQLSAGLVHIPRIRMEDDSSSNNQKALQPKYFHSKLEYPRGGVNWLPSEGDRFEPHS